MATSSVVMFAGIGIVAVAIFITAWLSGVIANRKFCST